mmetsp:Transcript_51128/g.76621  ORF Transcript_51128/g.76621 Transcript_51128/m.76621 type:complete len:126 (+) Transcript_51128:106-483(+)
MKEQRYQYSLQMQNMPSRMTNERINALESIGFMWDGRVELLETTWWNRFHKLRRHKDEFGDCEALRCWVDAQVKKYRRMNRRMGCLSSRQKLKALECMYAPSIDSYGMEENKRKYEIMSIRTADL